MNDPGRPGATRSLERAAFEALVALLLAPILSQGVWRPLAHVFGLHGSAAQVTMLALATTVIMVVTRSVADGRSPWLVFAAGGLSGAAGSTALSLGVAGMLTLLAVAAAVGGLLPWLSSRLPVTLDGLARRHARTAALYVLASVAVLVSTARVCTYMGDPDRTDLQAVPGDAFIERHSCLTAYVRASALAGQRVTNVYADPWWYGSNGLPPLPAGEESPYSPFALDNFSYPPPFLLLVAPLDLFAGDFPAQRALWFGMIGLVLAVGLWVVARWIDGPSAHRALLLAPLFLGCLPTLAMLQIGNFHVASVVLSVLAMVAIDRERPALGGALLALTILSKVSPGILAITLLARRRFRPAAFCAGFGLLWVGLAALRFGVEPIHSFLTFALPRLASGAAFPFMDTDAGIVTNLSPFGIAFKLPLFGIHLGDPWRVGPVFARVFTGLLLVLTLATARRPRDRVDQAIAWMALLVLASMQSPFSPGYAAFGLLWATTLLACEVRGRTGVAGIVGLWIVALVVPHDSGLVPRAAHALMQTALVVGVCTWLLVRRREQARIA